jgi:hypothetical protein
MEPRQGGIKYLQGIEWVGHPLPMPKYIQQLSERFNIFANVFANDLNDMLI